MKSKKKMILIGVIVITFLFIFILNEKTLYLSDDFLYRFEFTPDMNLNTDLTPVNGISSLIRSQYHHYQIWNGRFVAHTLIQFFMQYSKVFFNIINTFVFIGLGLLVTKIAEYVSEQKNGIFPLIITYVLMFLLIPSFGQTVLWISGAVNYLWMSLLYLGFFYFNIKPKEDNIKTILTAIIFGFLAGATNENTGSATILMISILAVYQLIKDRKVNIWRISGIISSLIGFALIILSPAAQIRASTRGEVALSLEVILDNIDNINQYIISEYISFIVIIILLIVVLWKNERLNEKITVAITTLFIGFIGATYSLIAVNEIIGRTMFGPSIFLITIMIILITNFIEYIDNTKIITMSILPILIVLAYTYGIAFKDVNNTYNQVTDQYTVLYSNPGEDVEIPMLTSAETEYNAYKRTNYFQKESNTWLNRWASKFFNVNSISGNQK